MRDHANQSKTGCTRCGQCCLTSSPSLQKEDLVLVREGVLEKRNLMTIRKGEGVRDNIHEELMSAPVEMIKIKEKKGVQGGCIFYLEQDKSCAIYDHRPLQCSAFLCRDTREFLRIYESEKLLRRDIVEDETLLGLIEAHEERCSYALLEDLVKKIPSQGEVALEALLDLLRFDYELRPFVSQKLGIDSAEMDFFFGRPLNQTIAMFGLRVIREEDGGFLLTT